MPNLNEVNLMGNLTRDVELKYTQGGMAIADVGIAINRKWRDQKTNELREEVTFVNVTFFGKQAETLRQYTAKGDPLYVKGRLKLDSWDDKGSGKKQYRLKVIGEMFQFLRSKSQGEQGQPPTSQPQRPQAGTQQPQQQEPFPSEYDIKEEDVPF